MANRAVSLLTDRQAKLAKKTIAVGGVKGLTLRVRETQEGVSKVFILRISVDGKPRNVSLGPYPQISLEEARKTALVWRNQMLKGENPREEAIEARKAKTVKGVEKKTYSVQRMLLDFCEFGEKRYWNNSTIKGQKLSRTHAEIVNGYMKNHIPAEILKMPAKDLTPEILAEAFTEKWKTMVDTPERIFSELKRSFDYAIRNEKIPMMQNPADLNGRLRDLLPPNSEREKKVIIPRYHQNVSQSFFVS